MTVDRTTDPIQVYGFLPDGRRVGFYLPSDATADQVITACTRLRDYLNLADLGLWTPAPQTVTPEQHRAKETPARRATDAARR